MGQKYDEETRGAVIAALMAGQSINSVAREYNIPKGTIAGWKSREADPAVRLATGDPSSILGTALYEYVTESLQALRAQARVFGDESWIRKQKAHEMGVLHGILTDKAVRILEAMSKND